MSGATLPARCFVYSCPLIFDELKEILKKSTTDDITVTSSRSVLHVQRFSTSCGIFLFKFFFFFFYLRLWTVEHFLVGYGRHQAEAVALGGLDVHGGGRSGGEPEPPPADGAAQGAAGQRRRRR